MGTFKKKLSCIFIQNHQRKKSHDCIYMKARRNAKQGKISECELFFLPMTLACTALCKIRSSQVKYFCTF